MNDTLIEVVTGFTGTPLSRVISFVKGCWVVASKSDERFYEKT